MRHRHSFYYLGNYALAYPLDSSFWNRHICSASCFVLYRADYYAKAEESEEEEAIKANSKGLSEVIIAKHRNGPVDTRKLLFQSNITKFKNPLNDESFDAF